MSLRLDSIIIWILLSFLPSKSYSYGIEFDFDTSILTYEYKYHFHLLNQMYGTEVDFDTCILFLMLISWSVDQAAESSLSTHKQPGTDF